MNKRRRKEIINYLIKQSQDMIKSCREDIDELKRELDFMKGQYDKTWEEEYCGSSPTTNKTQGEKDGQ